MQNTEWETITEVNSEEMLCVANHGDLALFVYQQTEDINDANRELPRGALGALSRVNFVVARGDEDVAHGECACLSLLTAIYPVEMAMLNFFHEYPHIPPFIADDPSGDLLPLIGDNLYWVRFEVQRDSRNAGIAHWFWAEAHNYIRTAVEHATGSWLFQGAFYDFESSATLCMPALDHLLVRNHQCIPFKDRLDRHRVLGLYDNGATPANYIYEDGAIIALPYTYSFAAPDRHVLPNFVKLLYDTNTLHAVSEHLYSVDKKSMIFFEINTTDDAKQIMGFLKESLHADDEAFFLSTFFVGRMKDNPMLGPLLTSSPSG
jgi:hypothetical protein